jgi:hypothetical protein
LNSASQFRYAPAQEPRLLSLDPATLWFEACASSPAPPPHSTQSRNRRRHARSRLFRFGALQSTPAADHESIGMFAPHRSTCHSPRLSGGIHPARQRTIPSALVVTTSPRVAPR